LSKGLKDHEWTGCIYPIHKQLHDYRRTIRQVTHSLPMVVQQNLLALQNIPALLNDRLPLVKKFCLLGVKLDQFLQGMMILQVLITLHLFDNGVPAALSKDFSLRDLL